jgi:hypothetical protein
MEINVMKLKLSREQRMLVRKMAELIARNPGLQSIKLTPKQYQGFVKLTAEKQPIFTYQDRFLIVD